MQVQPINNTPAFGHLIITDTALSYLNKNIKQKNIKKTYKMLSDLSGTKPNLIIELDYAKSIFNSGKTKEYMVVQAGEKKYTDRFLISTYLTVKKAVNYIKSLYKK